MERYFIIDKFNTWFDWHSILESKNIDDPEPKTNYQELDGMNGSLDLSDALTGEITYKDRVITASFFTDYGNLKERAKFLQKIVSLLHGKKVRIIEPDDHEHYFYGRIKFKSKSNVLSHATFTIEATCEPWRYSIYETERLVKVNSTSTLTQVVINNNGTKTLCPALKVTGSVNIVYNGITTQLKDGTYKISDLKLYQGVNIIGVSGNGSVTFEYREADL